MTKVLGLRMKVENDVIRSKDGFQFIGAMFKEQLFETLRKTNKTLDPKSKVRVEMEFKTVKKKK